MPKKKWILMASAALLLSSTLVLTACSSSSGSSSSSQKTSVSTSKLSTGKVSSTLSKVDNSKWQYNTDDNVYYQIGISYAASPTDASQQTLSIFVPGDYMSASDNGDGTYTCTIKTDTKVGNYSSKTAPIVIPINTPGYSAMSALTEYSSDAATYTAQGMIYVSAGLRGRDSGAPTGVTDAKAAIKYIRYNKGNISGNTKSIFVFGMSGGGAQASIIGSSGDSELYDDYLNKIGAVKGVSDSVAGVMAWCPITNLDTANEAYEWNMGSTRSGLTDQEQSISTGLATAYAKYINKLKLKDDDGKTLSLKTSDQGTYQAGTYYKYIKSVIEDSLNTFLKNTSFPYDASSTNSSGGMTGGTPSGTLPDGDATSALQDDTSSIENTDNITRSSSSSITIDLSGTYNTAQDYINALNAQAQWVTYDADSNTATITSVDDFAKYMKSTTKGLGAFDALDLSQCENQLFGYGDGNSVHWDSRLAKLVKGTDYESAFTTDLAKKDSLRKSLTTRINMYTPLYYLTDYYGGENSSKVASYWRIRTGASQGDTALTTEINLALALENYGVKDVDFATVWGLQHTEAEITGDSTSNFISWVNDSLSKN